MSSDGVRSDDLDDLLFLWFVAIGIAAMLGHEMVAVVLALGLALFCALALAWWIGRGSWRIGSSIVRGLGATTRARTHEPNGGEQT